MSGKKVCKEKAIAYTQALVSNGYNKTQAILKTNPNLSYNSAKKHTSQYHNAVVNSGHMPKIADDPAKIKERYEDLMNRCKLAKRFSTERDCLRDMADMNGMIKHKIEQTFTENTTPAITNDDLAKNMRIELDKLEDKS